MPAITDATPSDFVIERSADAVTASVSVALSFAAFGSETGAEAIDAVFDERSRGRMPAERPA